jgi:hypothetical protein
MAIHLRQINVSLPFRQRGIQLALYSSDTSYQFEIQRAPDSAGSPNVGAAVTIASNIQGTEQLYIDPVPQDGTLWWYQARQTGFGDTPSAWVPAGWVSARAGRIPPNLERPVHADPIRRGLTYGIPVVGATRPDGSVDLGGTGWYAPNKTLAYVADDAGTDRRAASANQLTGGTRAFSAIDVLGILVTSALDFARAYANKHLGNIPDDAGSDRRAATANQLTGAGRAFSVIDSGLLVIAGALDFARAYTNKHLGNVPDDAGSDRRAATANQLTGATRGFTAIDSGGIVVIAAIDFSRGYTNKNGDNLPRSASNATPVSTIVGNLNDAGAAASTLQQVDGTQNRSIQKGLQRFVLKDGDAVTYSPAFSIIPFTRFTPQGGALSYEPRTAQWIGGAGFNAALPQGMDMYINGHSATGGTLIAKLRQQGGTTVQGQQFPTGNALTTSGTNTQATAMGVNAPSANGHYTVRITYSVSTASGTVGASRTAVLTVAINKRAGGGGGAITNLDTRAYIVTDSAGTGTVTNSGTTNYDLIATLGSTDVLEVAITSFSSGGAAGTSSFNVHGKNTTNDGVNGVEFYYGTADCLATMTPGPGNSIVLEAWV